MESKRLESLDALRGFDMFFITGGAGVLIALGKLVYGTCSVFDAENMGIVKRFLQARPDFKLKPFKNPHDGGKTDGTLTTLPCHADCDCSFTALFVRNGGR